VRLLAANDGEYYSPCGEALGSTCWKDILGYRGNCLIVISGCGDSVNNLHR